MGKIEDGIDKYILRRIAYNIPEKAIIKRTKLRGEIFNSPVLENKRCDLNTILNFSSYNDIVLEFENILSKNFENHSDISSFYRNIQSLIITEEKSTFLTTIKRLLGKSNEGIYYPELNEIGVITDNNGKNVLFHELLHLASTKVTKDDIVFTGFCQGQEYGKKVTGMHLNEGYTEYLNCKYFIQKDSIYYEDERIIARGIEDIIGSDKMEELYFNSDLKGLIKELSKHTSEKEVINLIARLDTLTTATMSKMDRIFSEARQSIAKIKINKVNNLYRQGKISELDKEKQILFAKLYSLKGLVFENAANIEKENNGIRITDCNNNVFIDEKANIKEGIPIFNYKTKK